MSKKETFEVESREVTTEVDEIYYVKVEKAAAERGLSAEDLIAARLAAVAYVG